MSDETSDRTVEHELANRLDSLFDEDAPEPQRVGEATDNLLAELESLVMSIEWEITDELMDQLVAQVEKLKKRYGDDRILVMFLQLLGSLGLYVKTNKGNAHPSAFGLLSSVYASFARAAAPDAISVSEKKKLLYVELNKYKELKEQLGLTRQPRRELAAKPDRPQQAICQAATETAVNEDRMDDPRPSVQDDAAASVTRQEFEAAMVKIEQLIRDEFKRLREALVREDDR